MTITGTTDFDSGGGVEIDVDGTDVFLEHISEVEDDGKGYLHFRLDGVEAEEVHFEFDEDHNLPSDHRLMHSTESGPGDRERFDEPADSADGWSHEFDEDTVYISAFHVYPYEDIVDRVDELDGESFVETEVIGESEEGRDIHAIRIIGPGVDEAEAKDVVALARQHPGETQGSYHMDAGIDWAIERFERGEFNEDYIFHFIPDANPDGIYHGAHDYHPETGINQNRDWSSKELQETQYIADYISENVDDPEFGFDHHSSGNWGYTAIFYHESVNDMRAINLSYISQSLSGTSESSFSNRSRGFFYDETGGQMVTTEVYSWALRESSDIDYDVDEMHSEGELWYEEVTDHSRYAPRESPEYVRSGGEWVEYTRSP